MSKPADSPKHTPMMQHFLSNGLTMRVLQG